MAPDASAPFVYETQPVRVVFGARSLAGVADACAQAGIERAAVVCTPEQRELGANVQALLGTRSAGLIASARMHTPMDVTEAALVRVDELQPDGLVAVGGGSAIGLSKAIAVRRKLPQVAIPTTYAGSEMTPILGETTSGRKTILTDPLIRPRVVLYDPLLTLGLPTAMSVSSGFNAIAHAVEALYAPDTNPVVSMMAEEGIAALMEALPRVSSNGRDVEARSRALYGAWLCGVCLGSTKMSLHHKLCHTLGGLYDLPHAETHTAVLPHVLAYNGPAAQRANHAVARALQSDDAAGALFERARSLGATMALRDLGMPKSGIEEAIDAAMSSTYANPRALERDPLRRLLTRAWRGDPPH